MKSNFRTVHQAILLTICWRAGFFAVLLVLLWTSLAACSGQAEAPVLPVVEKPKYVPPTAAATVTPLASPSPTPVPPTPRPTVTSFPTATPNCADNLTYIKDLSIPDGTEVSPGETLDKRWQVKNSGTCNWDKRYRLRLLAGQALGAAQEQTLYPARSGTEAQIRILFTAPLEAGNYRSAWQAYDPQGEAFGDPVYIDFVVAAGSPALTATP